MQERTLSQLSPDEQADVKRRAASMWARGLYHREIAAAVGVTLASFERLTRVERDQFPMRVMGGGQASADAHKGNDSPKHALPEVIDSLNRRFGEAFLPLPNTTPVPHLENRGCSWPISITGGNPLSEPHSGFCCGRQRERLGDRLSPYCQEHQRIAYVPRAR